MPVHAFVAPLRIPFEAAALPYSLCDHTGAGNKVRAEAATCSCAAPEVLQSLQQLHQYGHWSMIDGAAADVWSSGVVLFQLLTGQEPFPRDIDKPFKSEWLRYSAARQAQYSWVCAHLFPLLWCAVKCCSG